MILVFPTEEGVSVTRRCCDVSCAECNIWCSGFSIAWSDVTFAIIQIEIYTIVANKLAIPVSIARVGINMPCTPFASHIISRQATNCVHGIYATLICNMHDIAMVVDDTYIIFIGVICFITIRNHEWLGFIFVACGVLEWQYLP